MPSGSRPLEGSSSTSTSGSPSRAAARPRRCRMPMLYSPARLRAAAGMPVSSSSSSTRRSGTDPASARTRRWSRPLRPGWKFVASSAAPTVPIGSWQVDVATTVDGRGAAGLVDQPQEHPERGGLARAVGAEEAGDAAGLDVEVQVVDGDEAAEALGQPPDLDARPCRSRGGHAGTRGLMPRSLQPHATSGSTPRWNARSAWHDPWGTGSRAESVAVPHLTMSRR